MSRDIIRKDKSRDSIAPEQLRRMLTRYASTLDAREKLNPFEAHPNLARARTCVDAALGALSTNSISDARHLCGVVQGILLASGIHTWEYLASDDRRE